jgi:hypothetical protein
MAKDMAAKDTAQVFIAATCFTQAAAAIRQAVAL